MGCRVNRGDVWLAEVGGERRPVLVLTRSEVLDVRLLVTVAEISTSKRGLATEVPIDHVALGLHQPSVINCDGLHTIKQSTLTASIGEVDHLTLHQVCEAIAYALGC
jgi:mRNA interferase MazF